MKFSFPPEWCLVDFLSAHLYRGTLMRNRPTIKVSCHFRFKTQNKRLCRAYPALCCHEVLMWQFYRTWKALVLSLWALLSLHDGWWRTQWWQRREQWGVCALVYHCVFLFVQRHVTAQLNSIFNATLSYSVRSLCFVCISALIPLFLKRC